MTGQAVSRIYPVRQQFVTSLIYPFADMQDYATIIENLYISSA